jgi:hypothetical protein
MRPDEMCHVLVALAVELARPPTLKRPGTEDDRIRRGLPAFLQELPETDQQLVELAALVEDVHEWEQIAESVRKQPRLAMSWTSNRGYREFLDELLSVARDHRQRQA